MTVIDRVTPPAERSSITKTESRKRNLLCPLGMPALTGGICGLPRPLDTGEKVSLPNDGIGFQSHANVRSDETEARFEEPAYRAYRHRRRHWRGPVFRFRQGHPERGSGAHTRIRGRRLGDLLYYARSRRIAPVSSGRRF